MTVLIASLLVLCALTASQVLVTYLVFYEGPFVLRAILLEILTSWVILFTYVFGYLNGDPYAGNGGGRPILLVHGYFMNRACMFLLQRRLKGRGYTVFTVLLRPIHAPIEDLSRTLSHRVDDIRSVRGEKLILIGHSMGGLVSRYYCEKLNGGAHVSQIITIGSPHSGTRLARLGLGRNAYEMRPSSEFLRSLSGSLLPGVRYAALWSPADNMVIPSPSARLDGAENIQVEALGHLTLLYSSGVFSSLTRLLPPP